MVHIYRHEGKLYPSVTTIIHAILPEPPALKRWKEKTKNADQIRNESAAFGTLIHYRILNNLSVKDMELPTLEFDHLPHDALQKVEICEAMWDELKLEIGYPRMVEKLVVNPEHRYAGKIDLGAPIRKPGDANEKKVFTLLDIKSSREVRENYLYQMGGYALAMPETPERALIVSLHPNSNGNKYLKGHIVEMSKSKLDHYGDKFIELAEEFHKQNLTEKLLKEHKKIEK